MPHELTHASFFSGVGGLDIGLERAGWRTVSFSEIDPYASAVLAERWPGVPNLGDIVQVAGGADDARQNGRHNGTAVSESDPSGCHATLWSGGFPCQDLSVAGKRAGFTHGRGNGQPAGGAGLRPEQHGSEPDGAEAVGRAPGAGSPDGDRYADLTRSGLAFAFLDLVECHRPPAILLENVPGLLSSNRGRDFGALLDRLAELGYWWAYRILDAQYFGVPQRRRRVFILALHAGAGFGADSAAAVLSVGSRCDGHSAAGDAARTGVAAGVDGGADRAGIYNATAKFGEFVEDDIAGNLSARDYKSSNHLIGAPPDPGGVRTPDGLAGRLDDNERVVNPILSNAQGGNRTTDLNIPLAIGASEVRDDPLLPLGLDSHRYRCCGNGVVSNVSEWIGVRLAEAMA